ncbi:MAG: hybrid sensor histidine kinase/response regulator [SAR86 cluster bacterium]|uniref:histidine kinase n=1 Tax=SAR86 cluster bacterium TaxID=2030880 RepID=A0A2A4XE74_9GAMM|nr:MAG: hybrid sensor histidine kinase/response regulator [SAR86 cluster bacterium]
MVNKPIKQTILVVDDTPENIDVLSNLLRDEYIVKAALNGEKALLIASSKPVPDMILLDIMMPDMDGYEVCRQLKAMSLTSRIPIIFITAKTEMADEEQGLELGALDYITKPISPSIVKARVGTHLDNHRYQLEIEHKNTELKQTLSKLKEAQAKLVQSEKMASLGVLTAGIAHEINNPINFLQASAKGLGKALKQVFDVIDQYTHIDRDNFIAELERIDQLKKDFDFDDLLSGVEELIANISDGADRTAEISRGLRAFSRLDEADKKIIDIHEGIDSTLTMLNYRYKDSIIIRKEYGDIPAVQCYPGKLNQVFMNILANAIDAIEEKRIDSEAGIITIKTDLIEKTPNDEVVISISDTGTGITPEVLKQLFDPFFTTKDVGEGTGLGMAISQGIIEDHEGLIEVESKVGDGSTITVHLPLKV